MDFSSEFTEAGRKWQNILLKKNAKGKNCQPRNLYPMKISFINKGKSRHSQRKKNKENFSLADLPIQNN